MVVLSGLQLMAEEVAVVGLQVDFYWKMIAHLKSLKSHKYIRVNAHDKSIKLSQKK